MISSIEIENLRGIHSGRLEGLAPLTLLTGLNGSGKSTVLDALLIAASPDPEEAVGLSVQRRPEVLCGARWLTSAPDVRARLTAEMGEGVEWKRQLEWHERCDEELVDRLGGQQAQPPFSMVRLAERLDSDVRRTGRIAFGVDNRFAVEKGKASELFWSVKASRARRLSGVETVRLFDEALPAALHRAFTEATHAGRQDDLHEILAELVPDFDRLQILVEDNESPTLYLQKAGRALPVGLAGDGIQTTVRLALELAAATRGTVLVESPESRLHPKSHRQIARVLLAGMRRGVQIVCSTHSRELIETLLENAGGDDLEKMALFDLRPDGGRLESERRDGAELVPRPRR